MGKSAVIETGCGKYLRPWFTPVAKASTIPCIKMMANLGVTVCVHFDLKEDSPCHECWHGENEDDSALPIEDYPGNAETSRCPRVTFSGFNYL